MKKLYSFFVLCTLLFCYTGNVWGEQLNEGFDATTFPPTDWKSIHVASSQTSTSWTRSTSYKHNSSTASAYMAYGASGKKTMNYLITPQLAPQSGESISFYVCSQSYSGTTLTIEVSEGSAVEEDFTETIATYTTGSSGTIGSTTLGTWVQKTISIPSKYIGKKIYIAFHVVDNYGSHIYLDDVSGVTIATVTCPVPTGLEASSVTDNSATISWTAGGTEEAWLLQYKASGDTDWSTANSGNNITTNSFSLTGLSANTTYSIRVKAVCDVEDESEWTAVETFDTPCEAKSIPYEYGFEDVTTGSEIYNTPDCWAVIRGVSYQSYFYVVNNSTNAKTGNKYLYIYCNRNVVANAQYAILPILAQEIKNLSLSFAYKTAGGNSRENLQVGYVTNPKDASTFVATSGTSSDRKLPISNSDYSTEEITFAGAPDGARIAIRLLSTGDYYGASVYIDDISVTTASSCVKPTGLTATAASASSINLSWTKGSDETQWNAQYRVGSGAWTAVNNISTTVSGTSCSATLTGLSANTTYEIQVQADCSGTQSGWSASATETTDCDKQSIPWTCGFETSEGYTKGSSSSGAPNKCWEILNMNGSTPYVLVNNSSSYVKTGSQSLYFESSNSRDGYIIFPELNAALNTLQIEFYHKEESAEKSSTLTLGYMTDVTDANSFVALKDDPFTRVADTWNHEEESLAGVPANVASTARLAFKVGKTSNSNWYLGIDDITISELPSCPKPSLTATNVIYNGATITWALGSADNKWKLQYKASTDDEWSDANNGNLIAASSFNLTGLTSGTTYQVRAQAECEGAWSNAVSFQPQCVTPTGLSVSSITTTTASVNWTVNSGENEWNIQYKKSSDASWTTIENVTTHPYSLTNLAPGSTYQVKVAATCNGTYTSAQEFDTECATVTSFPWVENFEDKTVNTIVKCWDISASATTTKSGSSNYYVWGVHSYSSNKMIRMYNYMVKDGSAIIYSPSITIPDDEKEYLLTFDYSNLANCGALKAKISINGGSTFTEVGSYTNASSTNEKENPGSFTTAKISLADYAGETIILQFYALANYSEGAIFVDNIKIAEKPDCTTPTGLTASSVAANTATISWTAGDEETNWALQYKAENGSWSDAIEVSTTPSHGLTGLSGNTLYYVRVKAVCGGGKESEYTDGTFNFRTECDTKTLPYEETFESGISPECWTAINGSYSYYDQTGNNCWKVTLDNDNNYVMRYKSANNSVYPVLTLQQIALPENAVLRFKVRNIYSNKTVAGKVTISAAGVSDRVVTLTNSNSLTAHEVALDAFAGKTVTIKFQATSNAASAYLDIDDIRVARTITLADDTDNSSLISTLATEGATVDVLLSRSLLMDGDYNPLCLPFSLSAAQLADEDCPLSNFKLKVFDYTQEVGDELHLYIAGASNIEAGVPYFVSYQGEPEAVKAQHLFRDVKITATTEGTKTHEKVTYQGTFAPKTLTDQSGKSENPEILFLGADNTIYYPNANVNLKGFRAYFTVDYTVGAPARAIRKICFGEQGENTATGIDEVESQKSKVESRKCIENGMLYIIRDGVKYTVLGQKIQ